MGNCLITKLKESVNNPNLPYMGFANIKVSINVEKPDNENLKINRFIFDGVGTVKFEGTGFDTPVVTESDVWKLPIGPMNGYYHVSKYNLIGIFLHAMNVNLSSFSDIISLQNISCPINNPTYGITTGDVSALSKLVNLTSINIVSNSVIGDISSLGSCINLRNITLMTYCSGTIESFVAKQRQNGRTTCESILINYPGHLGETITFNGTNRYTLFGETESNTLSWTENTITWGDITINA